jgi:hypothetical protein
MDASLYFNETALIIAPEQLHPLLHTLTLSCLILVTIRGFAIVKRKLQVLIAEDNIELSAIVVGILSSEFDVVGVVSNGRDRASRRTCCRHLNALSGLDSPRWANCAPPEPIFP